VVNPIHNKVIETTNLTIMDYAVKYINENELSEKLIPPINYMRYYKRMILPCEVIGMRGRSKTFQFECLEALSCILWRNKFDPIPKPSLKTKEIWKDFLNWMLSKEIFTVNDFDQDAEFEYQIS